MPLDFLEDAKGFCFCQLKAVCDVTWVGALADVEVCLLEKLADQEHV